MVFLFLSACLTPAETDSDCDPLDCDGDQWVIWYDCDDANGSTEASTPTAYYPDIDGDGVGRYPGEAFCEAPPKGWVLVGGDCDDTDPSVSDWPC